MKQSILFIALFCLFTYDISAQVEYKIITAVESIIPAGLGRSRILEANEEVNVQAATGERIKGTDGAVDDVKRKNLKIDQFKETKLLNFFSPVGLNFQNIASNDAMVSAKLNELAQQGWELAFVASGVESNSGEVDGEGIFITRYIFKRNK
jgi:hypothetical protein